MQVSEMVETIFQCSDVPLTVGFRTMWQVVRQKHDTSALGPQRVLGLVSYRTAWPTIQNPRRPIVRPGREKLRGHIGLAHRAGEKRLLRRVHQLASLLKRRLLVSHQVPAVLHPDYLSPETVD